jgi:hypothetical protein
MADNAFPGAPGLDTGRIEDFVKGVKEAQDKYALAALAAAGVFAGITSWSAYKRRH